MKRLLLAVAALCAFAAFAAAAAIAAGPGVTLVATPASLTVGSTVTLSGVFTPAAEDPAVGEAVYLAQYDDASCSTFTTYVYDRETATTSGGAYSVDVSGLPVGNYWYRAEMEDVDAVSACVPVTVTAAPAVPAVPSDTISSSYLCWNRWMTNPVAYIDRTADTMWKTGNYVEPQAILGNVVGGTNIGAYHLVCNAPATMTMTDLGLGGSGEVYNAAAMAAYHATHPGGNDLNVYHIWK